MANIINPLKKTDFKTSKWRIKWIHFIVNISGTESVSIIDIAKMIQANSLESEIEIEYVSQRLGDIRDSIGSIERAKSILGFHPSVPIGEGLQRTLEWYQSTLSDS